MTQYDLDTIYEAIDQLEGHAATTIGLATAKMISSKANIILEQEFGERVGEDSPLPE